MGVVAPNQYRHALRSTLGRATQETLNPLPNELKDRLDLYRHAARQRNGAHGTASGDAMLLAEDVAHQFAEAVDDGGVIDEFRRRIDQA